MSEAEFENVFKRKELYEMYSSGDAQHLDNIMDLEDVGLTIGELKKKIDFYKEFKKKKRQDIDNEIKIAENKITFFETVILSTLKHYKEKGADFPGSCKIGSRNNKGVWIINDEEELIKILQEVRKASEEEDKALIDKVLQSKVEYSILKKEANKLLDSWQISGKLEELLDGREKEPDDIVKKGGPSTSVSVKIIEEKEECEVDEVFDIAVPKKDKISDVKKENLEDFDSIEN